MASIISSVTSVVTAAVGWVGQFVDMITGNDLLLLFAIVPIVGLGVGLLKRLFSVN